jgi:hypothetical protein
MRALAGGRSPALAIFLVVMSTAITVLSLF